MEPGLFADLGIALGLGLLVGLQREWSDTRVAGIRTFSLITLLGAATGALSDPLGGWVVAAALAGLAGVVVVGNVVKLRSAGLRGEEPDPGMTTEVAALVMFAVGAMLPLGYRVPAVVLGGTVAVLLQWKRPLHRMARRIGREDLQAVMRFTLVALVILPVLPDRPLGPYGVLNPFQIWLMVVLIVGISLGAYVGYKLLGGRGGTLAAGALGGLISSTATSVSYARRSDRQPARSSAAALVVMLASTVVFVRVIGELAVVSPELLRVTAPPLVTVMAAMGLLCAGAWGRARGELAAGWS